MIFVPYEDNSYKTPVITLEAKPTKVILTIELRKIIDSRNGYI